MEEELPVFEWANAQTPKEKPKEENETPVCNLGEECISCGS